MASLLRSVIPLLLIVLIVQEAEGSWFFGRRRRRSSRIPKPRNCQVGSWSGWSACSHRCGNAGTQYRTRAVTVQESWGGRCPYPLRETRGCNRNACQNGGSPARGYCRCRRGFRGTCCETVMSTTVAPTTQASTTARPNINSTYPPSPTTSLPCYCHNGGSPVCRSGRLQHCVCFRGCLGQLCQYCPRTTRRTFTSFTTRRPFSPSGSLRCYECKTSRPANDCTSEIEICGGVCFFAKFTLRKNGQRFYRAGCTKSSACRSACADAIATGIVTQCSIRCCRTNLCNDMRRPSKPLWLRFLLKLIEGLKSMLDAIATLLKAHVSRDLASFHKREIVSMMRQMDDAAQHIEDSSEPEALQAKRDVAETRMRALELLKKLDDYIEDPDFNKKK